MMVEIFTKGLVTVLLLCALEGALTAQDLESIKQDYSDEQYTKVIDDILGLDPGVFKSNRWSFDYMLASCLCKEGNEESFEFGRAHFQLMLSEYDLSDKLKKILREKRSTCTAGAFIADLIARNGTVTTTSGISSKTFGLERDKGAVNLKARLLDGHDDIDFSKRRLPKDEKIKVKKNIRKRPHESEMAQTENMVLFGVRDEAKLRDLVEDLEKTLRFFSEEFMLDIPNEYIQVHVLKSISQLETFAEEYHRIDLADNTLGYTVDADLSVNAYIPYTFYPGTLRHELFHLITHYNIMQMPVWMEEGMAALFEVSSFSGNKLLGEPNWRGEVIRSYGREFLNRGDFSLGKLMAEFNWASLDGQSEDVKTANAAYVAFFRYMFLYMQNEGYLAKFFELITGERVERHLEFFRMSEGERRLTEIELYENLIEKASGLSHDTFQTQFLSWLKQEVRY